MAAVAHTWEPLDPEARRRFFTDDGRLRDIPRKHAKLLAVLDHVAQAFELGRVYPEREVDEILRGFHPDHAALRRYLVDEAFLTRDGGHYWRSGGTVTL